MSIADFSKKLLDHGSEGKNSDGKIAEALQKNNNFFEKRFK